MAPDARSARNRRRFGFELTADQSAVAAARVERLAQAPRQPRGYGTQLGFGRTAPLCRRTPNVAFRRFTGNGCILARPQWPL